MTERGCRHRDLTQPAGEGDTLSVSCERGAFLVPPLLFGWKKTEIIDGGRLVCSEPGWERPRPLRPSAPGRGRACSHRRGGVRTGSLTAQGGVGHVREVVTFLANVWA